MKVYVEDLLVKNCSCCDFCYTNSQGCVCKLTGHITRYDESLEEMRNKCPLLSIADHDKQVRNEVVQEIRKQVECEKGTFHNKWVMDYYTMINILDQIQGETKQIV